MELLFVRHGRPHSVDAGNAVADPALDDLGVTQAEQTGAALAAGRYGAVGRLVASPLRRAVQTAEPAARFTGLSLAEDPRLVELDAGATRYGGYGFAGFTTREQAWDSVNAGNWDGQRFDPVAFRHRVVDGVEDIVAAHPDNPDDHDSAIAIFCHGGVISAYLGHVLRVDRTIFCAPGFASVTRVLADTGSYREMLSFNECGHLDNG